MRTNVGVAVPKQKTHEGGPARMPRPAQQLMRQVATCLLFENTFYEKGSTIADEIAETCKNVPLDVIADAATTAREDFHLRHVPLFLLAQMDLRRAEPAAKGLLATTVARVVQRPDEMGELLSIIRKVDGGKRPLKKVLGAQVKKGLAKAFQKFNGYQLAKWNRDAEIKLRDVLFLTHAKPKDDEQRDLWKSLVDKTLETADTWEVSLSAGADKKSTWERLLTEKKLGYMALLMNLRNMDKEGVDRLLVESALMMGANNSHALPFRFISAAKAAPMYAQALSDAMTSAVSSMEKLRGSTYLVLDVSGSMNDKLSGKGTLSRWEAGAALAILVREICESARVFTFSNNLVEVQNLRGIGAVEGINKSQPHAGTYLAETLKTLYAKMPQADRVIVVTDEQTADGIVPPPQGTNGYLVNVAPYKPALDVSGGWTRISGFSERILDFIRWEEDASKSAS